MPPAANRSGIWTGLAAAGIGLLCLGGGWWLGQLQTSPEAADAARRTLAGQASDLQQRLNTGEASEAEQQRLLELLVAFVTRVTADWAV